MENTKTLQEQWEYYLAQHPTSLERLEQWYKYCDLRDGEKLGFSKEKFNRKHLTYRVNNKEKSFQYN